MRYGSGFVICQNHITFRPSSQSLTSNSAHRGLLSRILPATSCCRTSKSCSYRCPVRSAVCPCSTRVAVQILVAGNFNVPRFPKLGLRFRQIAVDHYKNILAGMLHTSLRGAAIAIGVGCRSAIAMPPPCRLFPVQKTMPLAVPRCLPRESILR